MYKLHTHSMTYQRCESRRNQLKVAIVKLKMPSRRLQVNMSFWAQSKEKEEGKILSSKASYWGKNAFPAIWRPDFLLLWRKSFPGVAAGIHVYMSILSSPPGENAFRDNDTK